MESLQRLVNYLKSQKTLNEELDNTSRLIGQMNEKLTEAGETIKEMDVALIGTAEKLIEAQNEIKRLCRIVGDKNSLIYSLEKQLEGVEEDENSEIAEEDDTEVLRYIEPAKAKKTLKQIKFEEYYLNREIDDLTKGKE